MVPVSPRQRKALALNRNRKGDFPFVLHTLDFPLPIHSLPTRPAVGTLCSDSSLLIISVNGKRWDGKDRDREGKKTAMERGDAACAFCEVLLGEGKNPLQDRASIP